MDKDFFHLFNIGNILYSVSFFWKVCILNFIVPSIKCEFRDLYNLKIDLVIANEIIHVSVRKNHSYAWLSEDRLQILFSDTPPTGKQTYRVEVKFPTENNDRNLSEQFTPQQTTKKNKITR